MRATIITGSYKILHDGCLWLSTSENCNWGNREFELASGSVDLVPGGLAPDSRLKGLGFEVAPAVAERAAEAAACFFVCCWLWLNMQVKV